MLLPNPDHTFVILGYQKSPYIDECIASLKEQTVPSGIVISTSTPSSYLMDIARLHNIELLVHTIKDGIASDWSFGYRAAKTRYVTLAHQDDIYYPRYTEHCLAQAGRCGQNLITFTDYHELIGDKRVGFRANLIIKRMILFPFFLVNRSVKNRLFKTWMLCFGSPIPCPSVMYHKEAIGNFEFSNDFKNNLDWEAWIRLAGRVGDFVFVKEKLMAHRIHPGSVTTRAIEAQIREVEDATLFRRIWGETMGQIVAGIYRLSYLSNS